MRFPLARRSISRYAQRSHPGRSGQSSPAFLRWLCTPAASQAQVIFNWLREEPSPVATSWKHKASSAFGVRASAGAGVGWCRALFASDPQPRERIKVPRRGSHTWNCPCSNERRRARAPSTLSPHPAQRRHPPDCSADQPRSTVCRARRDLGNNIAFISI